MGREPPINGKPGSETWTIVSDLIAGAIAGVCCDTLLHPVDTVKSRLHVQAGPPFKYRSMIHGFQLISRQEGIRRGLYAGFGAVLAGTIPTHAIMFAGYKAIKRRGEDGVSEQRQLAAIDLMSGALGEVCALPVYVPTEVIAKRMQVATLGPARNYNSVTHAVRSIYRSEGYKGLLSGFWPTLLRDVPYTAIQFSLFSICKDKFLAITRKPELSDLDATGIGVIVGAIAATLTNPFDVIKTRFMTQSTGADKKYHSISQCFRKIVAEEGFRALGRGVGARVLWVGPGSGIILAVYERTSKHLRRSWELETSESAHP